MLRGMTLKLSEAWRAAVEMRKAFAGEAVAVASSRADQCFELGDLEGFRSWNRIANTLLEIERHPQPCEARH
jgi:hypothetical protein